MESAGWLAFAAGSYLMGSVPFGVIIGRLHGVDIREHGSRNIGATNVGRVLGRRWGLMCFALDAAKGAIPVLAAGAAASVLGRSAAEIGAASLGWWLLIVAAALAGHMWSPFIGFRGGKGVATGFGALAAFWPLLALPALIALALWLLVLKVGRMVSLASIAAAASLPISTLLLSVRTRDAWPLLVATILLATLVIVKHRSNIGRIMRGQEPRVGRRDRVAGEAQPVSAESGRGGGADAASAPGSSTVQNAR